MIQSEDIYSLDTLFEAEDTDKRLDNMFWSIDNMEWCEENAEAFITHETIHTFRYTRNHD